MNSKKFFNCDLWKHLIPIKILNYYGTLTLKVTNIIVCSAWHRFIETLRKGFYYQKNTHVIFKRLKAMANNVAITMKDSRACNRRLSHIVQKYFTEFKFGFLRNAKGHWIYYV